MAGKISKEFNIKDKDTQAAFDKVQKMAQDGINGNMETYQRAITAADAPKLKENKPYFDAVNNREVKKINGKLKFVQYQDLN